MGRSLRGLAAIGVTAGALAVSAATASAVTIGQLGPTPGAATCSTGAADYLNPTVTSGPSYTVPALTGTFDERITSWSTNAIAGPNQMLEMKVFRYVNAPTGPTYKAVGHDGPHPLVGGALNTFSGISVAVQPGDVLGVNAVNSGAVPNGCQFSVSGDSYLVHNGDLADGSSAMFFPSPNFRSNVTAVVEPAPSNTGQRAAALKKCKKKHSKKKRKKCKKKANLLPV